MRALGVKFPNFASPPAGFVPSAFVDSSVLRGHTQQGRSITEEMQQNATAGANATEPSLACSSSKWRGPVRPYRTMVLGDIGTIVFGEIGPGGIADFGEASRDGRPPPGFCTRPQSALCSGFFGSAARGLDSSTAHSAFLASGCETQCFLRWPSSWPVVRLKLARRFGIGVLQAAQQPQLHPH